MEEPVLVDEVACGMGKSQPDLTRVEPRGGSELLLEFETGERRLFDAAPFIDCGGSYGRLAEERYFAQVRIIDGGLALGWPEGQEVYPEALYEFEHACRVAARVAPASRRLHPVPAGRARRVAPPPAIRRFFWPAVSRGSEVWYPCRHV